MNRLNKILVVVDPYASSQACVAKAARIAAACGASVELFICDFSHATTARSYYDEATYELAIDRITITHREKLESLAEPLRASGLTVLTDVGLCNPLHEGVLLKVRAARPGLVIKDTHVHGIIGRTLITNTDWHLVRACPAPLLLTKEGAWRQHAPRIAAAVDPGHADDKPAALDHLLILAVEFLCKSLAGEPFVVNVFCALTDIMAATAGADASSAAITPDVVAVVRDDQRRRLQDLTAAHGVPPRNIDFIDGIAAEELPRYCRDKGIDILAMGAVARGRLFNLFIGSTAERTLDHLPCDVLILKPEAVAQRLQSGGAG